MDIQIIELNEDEELDLDSMNRSGEILPEVAQSVRNILADVKERGDEALREYTLKFDHADLGSFRVPDEMLDQAVNYIEPKVAKAFDEACESIKKFHANDVARSNFNVGEDGSLVGYKVEPLDSVGLYVPGGRAAYPSTVLMNGIPAKMAGVKKIVMTTPPSANGTINPALLYAAKLAGVDEVYAVGGAQAIGALAYGTQTVPKVDKIVGPGNVFVAAAKAQVSGFVGIDFEAGPSEILILADETTIPSFAAADLISQAEHDPNACCYLVTVGDYIVKDLLDELNKMVEISPRREIIEASLEANGLIVICPTMECAIDTANKIAPEHLEIMMDEPMDLLGSIHNAGAIFVGSWTPVPVGDYFAGPSHTLPTSGTARFTNPLTTDDFVKKSSVICYSLSALENNASNIARIARSEGFEGHARSIEERIEFIGHSCDCDCGCDECDHDDEGADDATCENSTK